MNVLHNPPMIYPLMIYGTEVQSGILKNPTTFKMNPAVFQLAKIAIFWLALNCFASLVSGPKLPLTINLWRLIFHSLRRSPRTGADPSISTYEWSSGTQEDPWEEIILKWITTLMIVWPLPSVAVGLVFVFLLYKALSHYLKKKEPERRTSVNVQVHVILTITIDVHVDVVESTE